MSFRYVCSIFSPAVSALDVVVVVGRRRGREVGDLSALGLYCPHLSHPLHCVLQLFMLDLPLGFLFLPQLLGLHRLYRFLLLLPLAHLNTLSFAHLLVLAHTIRVELPPATSTTH